MVFDRGFLEVVKRPDIRSSNEIVHHIEWDLVFFCLITWDCSDWNLFRRQEVISDYFGDLPRNSVKLWFNGLDSMFLICWLKTLCIELELHALWISFVSPSRIAIPQFSDQKKKLAEQIWNAAINYIYFMFSMCWTSFWYHFFLDERRRDENEESIIKRFCHCHRFVRSFERFYSIILILDVLIPPHWILSSSSSSSSSSTQREYHRKTCRGYLFSSSSSAYFPIGCCCSCQSDTVHSETRFKFKMKKPTTTKQHRSYRMPCWINFIWVIWMLAFKTVCSGDSNYINDGSGWFKRRYGKWRQSNKKWGPFKQHCMCLKIVHCASGI